MPAAAVIPAPIAYINVVAVKKLVVGFLARGSRSALQKVRTERPRAILAMVYPGIQLSGWGFATFTVKKSECSTQAYALNTLAWNNEIGPWRSILLVCTPR